MVLAGLVGLTGGVLFVLTFDGPPRIATRRARALAVGLMVGSSLLPSNLSAVVVVLSLLMVPSIWIGLPSKGDPQSVTSG